MSKTTINEDLVMDIASSNVNVKSPVVFDKVDHTSKNVNSNFQEYSNDKEMAGKSRLVTGLTAFAQSTTFHGFHFIFDAGCCCTKFIWLVIFLFSCGVLFYQMTDRVTHYQARPINVKMDVRRPESLPFPAVVLCNTNQYRMTAAESLGIYYDLRDYFSKNRFGKNTSVETRLDDLDMKELSLELAHQKEDFIFDCQWITEPCGLENFTRLVTDFGVCYVFNDGESSTRDLYAHSKGYISMTSGAAFGLRLVLNLEQYEYMAGPRAAAGVKLLLYNQTEFPRVRDLGLSIPPSTNTHIGFKVQQMENLKPPHGKCGKRDLKFFPSYSESSCEAECLTFRGIEKCGCREYYMSWETNETSEVPYCPISKTDHCHYRLRVKNSVQRCGCPLHCSENHFIASTSHSATSQFEASKKAYYISEHRKDIVAKYQAGVVSLHRLDDVIVGRDIELIERMYGEARRMDECISQTGGDNESSEFIRMLGKVGSDVSLVMQSVKKAVKGVKELVENETQTYTDAMGLEPMSYIMSDLENMLRWELSMLLDTLKSIAEVAPVPHPRLEVHRPGLVELGRKLIDRMRNIETRYFGRIDILGDILHTVAGIFTQVQAKTWTGTWRNERLELPVRLMRRYSTHILNAVNKPFKNVVDDVISKLGNLKSQVRSICGSIPNNGNIGKDALEGIFRKTHSCFANALGVKNLISSDITAAYKGYLGLIRLPKNKLEEEVNQLDQLLSNLAISMGNLNTQIQKFIGIKANPATEMNSTVQLIRNATKLYALIPYWRNLSKMDIARDYSQRVAHIAVDKSKVEKRDFVSGLEILITQIGNVMTLEYTVLDTLNASIRSRQTDNSTWSVGGVLRENIQQMPQYQNQAKSLKWKVDIIALAGRYREFLASLESFKDDMQIKSEFYRDNFLTVSLYYQSLQLEGVTQQVAYTWFELLSDIGGSAGLFLGASFLSIIELLFFICVSLGKTAKTTENAPPRSVSPASVITPRDDAWA